MRVRLCIECLTAQQPLVKGYIAGRKYTTYNLWKKEKKTRLGIEPLSMLPVMHPCTTWATGAVIGGWASSRT